MRPGREQENTALVRGVFEELAKARPSGMRYAVFQAADSREFVHLYTDEGGTPGARQQLASFQTFVAGAEDRHEQPATFKEFELIGAYRTFDDPDRPASAGGLRTLKHLQRGEGLGPSHALQFVETAGPTGAKSPADVEDCLLVCGQPRNAGDWGDLWPCQLK